MTATNITPAAAIHDALASRGIEPRGRIAGEILNTLDAAGFEIVRQGSHHYMQPPVCSGWVTNIAYVQSAPVQVTVDLDVGGVPTLGQQVTCHTTNPHARKVIEDPRGNPGTPSPTTNQLGLHRDPGNTGARNQTDLFHENFVAHLATQNNRAAGAIDRDRSQGHLDVKPPAPQTIDAAIVALREAIKANTYEDEVRVHNWAASLLNELTERRWIEPPMAGAVFEVAGRHLSIRFEDSDDLPRFVPAPAAPTIAPNKVLSEIADESDRAHAKHGPTSMRSQQWNNHRRITILAEELGELGTVLNDLDHGKIQPHQAMALARGEAVQLAAMAYDMVLACDNALDTYVWADDEN